MYSSNQLLFVYVSINVCLYSIQVSCVVRIHQSIITQLYIAVGEQNSLGGTMNLLECLNQNISKCTKIFSFFFIGLGLSLKKGLHQNSVPEYFHICPTGGASALLLPSSPPPPPPPSLEKTEDEIL